MTAVVQNGQVDRALEVDRVLEVDRALEELGFVVMAFSVLTLDFGAGG